MDDNLRAFIEGMPKTELHTHIEGTLEPELMFRLAAKNGVQLPYANIEEAKEKRRQYKDLWDFLNHYYTAMSVLKTEQDFYDLAYAYLEKAKSQNVTHTEIFFDPQEHIKNGVAFETAINGIHRAQEEAEKKLGVTSQLHMHFLRHLPEEDAFKVLEQAMPHMDKIDGFGLDSGEQGNPPEKFERLYMKLAEITDAKTGEPKGLMMHAGEEGPADYVRQALRIMKKAWDTAAEKLPVKPKQRKIRIDHGNHALDDDTVVAEMMTPGEEVGHTVCPYSNLRLTHTLDFATNRKLTDLKDHRLKEMLQKTKPNINSDDPAYFRTDANEGAYMNENLIGVTDKLGLTKADVIKLENNAIDISFLPETEKAQRRHRLGEYIARAEILEKRTKMGADTQVAV
jgi:adenosine deaminase